jgi:hypothetical protein
MALLTPRYLTPPRLAVLLLVEIYLSSPPFLHPDHDDDAGRSRCAEPSASPELLSFLVKALMSMSQMQIGTGCTELALPEYLTASNAGVLEKELEGIKVRVRGGGVRSDVWHVFLRRLWAIEGVDHLFTLFETELPSFVRPPPGQQREQEQEEQDAGDGSDAAAAGEAIGMTRMTAARKLKVGRTSPMAMFIRKSCLQFSRLTFAELESLWAAFQRFRAGTGPEYRALHGHSERLGPQQGAGAEAGEEGGTEGPGTGSPTRARPGMNFTAQDDTDALLTAAIQHLQKLGTRLPPSLVAKLRLWTNSLSPTNFSGESTPLRHFLAFFHAWRSGQYTLALECLHRYFDYSMNAPQMTGTDRAGGGGGAAGWASGARQYYQYALLHLSVLHADFEHWAEAWESVGDCVSTGTLPYPPLQNVAVDDVARVG